ncbi:MAG: arylsulfatase, partial [Gammaproteobacteria bacterium]|nr:arylsulfatase [Gammaproteobacteria bacterium]
LDETWPMEAFPEIRRTIDTTHDFSYEAMGHEGSYVLYGPNWANAGSPAFRLHKGFPTEGGTRVAAFVRYKGLVTSPSISDAFVFVADVTPTIVELAGVDPPGSKYRGRDIEPMSGRSFLPLLSGRQLEETSRTTAMELLGKRAVRRGEWKLVHMPPPHGAGRWQLFDVHADPGESLDLATRYPDTVADLVRAWDDYANRNGVILPDWVSGY